MRFGPINPLITPEISWHALDPATMSGKLDFHWHLQFPCVMTAWPTGKILAKFPQPAESSIYTSSRFQIRSAPRDRTHYGCIATDSDISCSRAAV